MPRPSEPKGAAPITAAASRLPAAKSSAFTTSGATYASVAATKDTAPPFSTRPCSPAVKSSAPPTSGATYASVAATKDTAPPSSTRPCSPAVKSSAPPTSGATYASVAAMKDTAPPTQAASRRPAPKNAATPAPPVPRSSSTSATFGLATRGGTTPVVPVSPRSSSTSATPSPPTRGGTTPIVPVSPRWSGTSTMPGPPTRGGTTPIVPALPRLSSSSAIPGPSITKCTPIATDRSDHGVKANKNIDALKKGSDLGAEIYPSAEQLLEKPGSPSTNIVLSELVTGQGQELQNIKAECANCKSECAKCKSKPDELLSKLDAKSKLYELRSELDELRSELDEFKFLFKAGDWISDILKRVRDEEQKLILKASKDRRQWLKNEGYDNGKVELEMRRHWVLSVFCASNAEQSWTMVHGELDKARKWEQDRKGQPPKTPALDQLKCVSKNAGFDHLFILKLLECSKSKTRNSTAHDSPFCLEDGVQNKNGTLRLNCQLLKDHCDKQKETWEKLWQEGSLEKERLNFWLRLVDGWFSVYVETKNGFLEQTPYATERIEDIKKENEKKAKQEAAYQGAL